MNQLQNKKMRTLQSVLETLGADPSRWPDISESKDGAETGREQLLAFVKQDGQAARLFAEAGALDHLLEMAVQREAVEPKEIVDLQEAILDDFNGVYRATRSKITPSLNMRKRSRTQRVLELKWLMPATLVACFAVGIVLGSAGFGDWSLDLADRLTSFTRPNDQLTELMNDLVKTPFDEELL